jgi:hypothetical protein
MSVTQPCVFAEMLVPRSIITQERDVRSRFDRPVTRDIGRAPAEARNSRFDQVGAALLDRLADRCARVERSASI